MKKRFIVGLAMFLCFSGLTFAIDPITIGAITSAGIKIYNEGTPEAEYIVAIFDAGGKKGDVTKVCTRSMADAKQVKDIAFYKGASKVVIRSVYLTFRSGVGAYYSDGTYDDSEAAWYSVF